MRAIYLAYVMALLSLSCGLLNELNELHVRDKGYPLIPSVDTGSTINRYNESNYNETVSGFGLDRVPSQAGDNPYLGSGGALLGTYNAFQSVFQVSTFGLSGFLRNMFPSIPLGWLATISVMSTIINVYAVVTFVRGVAARWL